MAMAMASVISTNRNSNKRTEVALRWVREGGGLPHRALKALKTERARV
jgi:hypothetical protein